MKNKILTFLMMFLCLQVNAQQRRKAVTQRRTTTSVKKNNPQAIKKTRKVGEDGFIWYELRKGNLYGATDIDGKTIIPIKYTGLYYSCSSVYGTHYFKVKNGDYKGVYTRRGSCIISPDKHFTDVSIKSEEKSGKVFLYAECKNNFGETGLYDIRGNEVIAPGNYEYLYIMKYSDDDLAFIQYTKGGLYGAYDLNGNLLTKPVATAYIEVYKDKIEIVNKIGKDEYDSKYIYGSYSEDTRFNYDNFDRIHYPFKPSLSNSSSSSSSTSSSSPSRNSSSSNSTSSSSSRSSSSRSSSSNSSSGHQQRQVWKERWRNCTACDPDRRGYCRNCHGRGGYYIGNYYNVCGICGGTGSCTMCGGRGEYKETYSTWE